MRQQNEDKFNFATGEGNTIDLQGVAAFAGLVETVAQELGATPGRIQGMLPSGPSTFQELVGEIPLTSQGFHRVVTLITVPGEPLKLRLNSSWREGLTRDSQVVSGVDAQFILGAPVDRILPQARALARHIEEIFSVLDRMATLGQSSRLAAMSISEADLLRFETQEGNLVRGFDSTIDLSQSQQ